jgi:site-specific recombinase XerD
MSDIENGLHEYLATRRTLGFKLLNESTALPQFLHFLEKENASFITTDLALKWATLPEDVLQSQWARRLSMVRIFAKFYNTLDPRSEIPPQGLLPNQYHRKPPYIYNDIEISRLIEASSRLESATGLRASTYSTLFGLLAVTGMRVSEPIALDLSDVDLTQNVLTVRETKFGKSRLIPIHSSTARKLEEYSQLRDRLLLSKKSSAFFLSERGERLSQSTIRRTFIKLSRGIGLRAADDSHGPRINDIRHTFTVKTIIKMYQTGVDVEHHMPELATYLGHTHVNDTYWYISAVPELLSLASSRLTKIYRERLS